MREDDEDAAKAVNGSKGRKSLTKDDDDGGMWNYFLKSLTFCFSGKTCWVC